MNKEHDIQADDDDTQANVHLRHRGADKPAKQDDTEANRNQRFRGDEKPGTEKK